MPDNHGHQQIWYEVKFSFSQLPDPCAAKKRLIHYLSGRNIPNVVESYFDGLSPDDSTEEAQRAIMAEEDALPLVVYCESRGAGTAIVSDVAAYFSGALIGSLRELDAADTGNPWTDASVFETERFVICPAGLAPDTSKHKILITPGEAFGNGQHVTTIAMLRALEVLNLSPTSHVLDVGTGCGVLLIAAGCLGAPKLTGTDLSAEIIAEARRNLALNCFDATTLVTSNIPVSERGYDLVLANIPIAGIRPLVPDILSSTTSHARFILSGFTAADSRVFLTELQAVGLRLTASAEERGWVALTLQKS